MEGGGLKLAFMLAAGLICIEVGLIGKLGSLLGAVIDPANLVESASSSSSSSSSSGNNTPLANTLPTGTVASAIQMAFGPYASQALQIANAESGLDPNAYNNISVGGSHAEGVFQVLYPSTWNTTSQASKNPYDPAANIRAAYEIFQRDGYSWREWATAPSLGLS